jgi:archaetidylinositol phosphate synthase
MEAWRAIAAAKGLHMAIFLDCMTDAFCGLVIMVGLGLSSFVRMDVSLFTLVGYYMLCIYVFLNHHITGIHKISFLGCGPTEMRLGLIVLNIWMFVQGRVGFMVGGEHLSTYDIVLIANGLMSVAVFIRLLMAGVGDLRDQEIGQATEALQLRDGMTIAESAGVKLATTRRSFD